MKNLNQFVGKKQSDWRKLEALLDRAEKRIQAFSDEELDELGKLYRQAASDLALAQRDFPGQKVTRYLNGIVARSHAVIYRGDPMKVRTIRTFFARTFPQIYRKLWPYTLIAFLVFLIPAIIAFFVVLRNPDAITRLLGQDVQELVKQVEQGEMWTEIAPAVRSTASTAILTNNIQVMFFSFAGGVTAGLLTLYVLFFNGLQIGALFGLLQAHGMSANLATFIIAHGVIELSVIFLSGGIGLYIGDGLLRPGLQRRRDALADRARTGVQAILGSIPLLVIAGLIEGFISPSALPWQIKAAVGAGSGLLLYGYWLLAGRKMHRRLEHRMRR